MPLRIRFSDEKNEILKATRGIGFDEIIDAIKNGDLLDDKQNPSNTNNHQRIYVVKVGDYAYVVPYIVDLSKQHIFLKTVYPSRKFTKLYIKKGDR